MADTGAADVKAAQEKLAEARRQRNEAAGPARSAVAGARDAAPEKPSYGEQALDGLQGLNLSASHFTGGIVKGTAGIVSFARSVNPTDPYNLTHPAEYLTSLNSTTAGLVRMANDPLGTAKTMYDGFMKDPAEGTGRLIPELLGTRGLGSIKKAATVAKHLPDEKPPKTPGRQDTKDGPHDKSRDPDCTKCDGDPVDVATGRVLLQQTDVSLPGTLPLLFKRSFNSSYRAGRWFGQTWSSTVDQRLEIDAEGVVFHGEDNLLLAYPHPAPEVPTLPVAGARWSLERTPEGDYVLTDPTSGHVRHFTGPADGDDGTALLEQISDRNGNRITFEYGPGGEPLSVVHSGGYHLKFSVEDERVTTLSLAGAADDGTDQRIKSYAYTDGHLTAVTNSSGLPLRFGCDELGRMTSWTDTNEHSFEYVYDDQDRCVFQTAGDGVMQYEFDYSSVDERTGYRITEVTDPFGGKNRNLINDQLQVVAQTDALGNSVRSDWGRGNRLLSHTDPLGRTTRYQYGELNGALRAVIRPDGHSVEVEVGEFGLPLTITKADGSRLTQQYDAHGNRTAIVDPAGNVTRYEYNELGHLLAVTDPLGAVTRIRCDSTGLPVEVADPVGAVTTYTRDAYGRPTTIADPTGGTTRLYWTVEGRLASRVGPDGAQESWTYDGEGNCTRHMDASGGTSSFEYTHFDLLVAQTGPDGARHSFTHDAELRLTQVTNPQGLTWSYTFDSAGRLIEERDFDGRVLRYELDAAGQLVSRTNPLEQVIYFERDVLGQVVRKNVDGRDTNYAYDPSGRLTQAVNCDAEVVLQYDKLGRIKTELVSGRALTHSYDALGRRIRRVTPTGAVSASAYDQAGNRTSLTASGRTMDFTHDAAGRESRRRIGDGVEFASTWDPAGRLDAQTVTVVASGARVQHRNYTYQRDGHLVGVEDQLNGPRVFEMDATGRVTGVRAQDWSESYAYDEAGNQTAADWPIQHVNADARGERMFAGTRVLSAGSIRYEYDAAGRVTLRQKTRLSKKPDAWRYTWDAEDHLTTVTSPDGAVWRYLYDPLGRRIAKQRLGGDGEAVIEQIDFTWDGPTLIEQTTTAPGMTYPVTLTWDHDGLRPLAQVERITSTATQQEVDSRFFAIVTDLVGTPTELLDEQGEIAWRTRSTLWGTTTWNADATTYTPLRFPGQYYDPETALHYNFHRHYDPVTARYTSPDPLGLTPAPNPATYVHNPHTWTDSLGLAPDGCPKGEASNPFSHKSEAEKAAFEAAGVPHGTVPDAEWIVTGNKQLKYSQGYVYSGDPTHWGHFRQFETENGSRVVVEHTFDKAGPHFHAGKPKFDDTRNGVNFGWDNSRGRRRQDVHRYHGALREDQ